MSAAIDYDRLARLHMPADPTALRAECRRLLATGLKPHDVAIALRIDLGQVLEALTDPPSSLAAVPIPPSVGSGNTAAAWGDLSTSGDDHD